jgi:hypothetical protein
VVSAPIGAAHPVPQPTPRLRARRTETDLAPLTRASGRTRQARFRYAANRRMCHVIDWWMIVAARDDPPKYEKQSD